MIKAIETVYKGYRFRSRLEARWAVFFDTLGIEYEYEKEGFDLDGVWYLPDFWLPRYGHWIEIKPDTPSPEEKEKAWRLAVKSGSNTFICCGNPYAEKHFVTLEGDYGFYEAKIEYKIIGFIADVFDLRVMDSFLNYTNGVFWMQSLYDFLYSVQERHGDIFSKPLLPKYLISIEGILEIIERDKEYFRFRHHKEHPKYNPGNMSSDLTWQIIGSGGFPFIGYVTRENLDTLHPKLIAAYAAARQARFEHDQNR